MRAKLREVAEASYADPRQAIMDALEGGHENLDVLHANVIVATYIRPEKTAGGIFLADRTLQEDRFQGKAGLVLKKGPLAFVDDTIAKFGGKTINEGDWVMVRPSDGMEFFASDKSKGAGISCRVFKDVDIIARLDDPALIY
jgi:co-chaperonin GroES (HSP10)